MQTRAGTIYYHDHPCKNKRHHQEHHHHQDPKSKRRKTSTQRDLFDQLPDDILETIMAMISSSASQPSDLVSPALVCKKFRALLISYPVLAKASPGALSLSAGKWSESAHRFLRSCCEAGNLEACFILGMVRFYCLQQRGGVALIARAAAGAHADALYALAVIKFNGSGGSKSDKDLQSGVMLCARAALLGHIDAMRELGHCLQDGYGIQRNVAEGRKLLVHANARELVAAATAGRSHLWHVHLHREGRGCPLLSDFGCAIPPVKAHTANRFMVDWFAVRGVEGGLRLCSHGGCGRVETRQHEFRRCSVCGSVNYCSRACQALDWKLGHKVKCLPMDRWHDEVEPHGYDGDEVAMEDHQY